MKEVSDKELFFTFFKIGAFTFGGGYAMIPLIRREIVEERKWLDDRQMLDIVAIAESTPGPLAVNAATFVGSRTNGVSGAFAATSGVVLPSFILIVLISRLLMQVENVKVVQYAFVGIRAGVLVLIAQAFLSLFKQTKKDWFSYILMAGAFLSVLIWNANTVIVLLVCGFLGIIRSSVQKGKGRP